MSWGSLTSWRSTKAKIRQVRKGGLVTWIFTETPPAPLETNNLPAVPFTEPWSFRFVLFRFVSFTNVGSFLPFRSPLEQQLAKPLGQLGHCSTRVATVEKQAKAAKVAPPKKATATGPSIYATATTPAAAPSCPRAGRHHHRDWHDLFCNQAALGHQTTDYQRTPPLPPHHHHHHHHHHHRHHRHHHAPAKSKAAAWSTPKECTKFFKLLEELKVKIDTVSREAAENYSHVDLKRIKVSGAR